MSAEPAAFPVCYLQPGSNAYPPRWQGCGDAPPVISAIGNAEILQQHSLALFCSVKCPGDLILQTYDLVRSLRQAGKVAIGGFHSPMEKECLTLLLRGSQPVIWCPARSLEGMRLLKDWQLTVEEVFQWLRLSARREG